MRKSSTRPVLWFLMLFFFILLGQSFAGEKRPVWWDRAQTLASQDGYQLITIPEFRDFYDSQLDFVIVDVRPDYEYRAGHLPKALQIEFHLGERSRLTPPKKQQFENILGPDKDREVIIYCRNYQ